MSYKIDDKVLVEHEGVLIPAKILKISKETKGILWWEKEVGVAVLEIHCTRRRLWNKEWEQSIEYTTVTLDKLTPIK